MQGDTTVGDIQAFIGYVTFMLWPVQDMARVFAQMQQSIASGERMFSLLDAVPDVRDKPEALEPAHLEGDIVFDHVTFYYEKGKPVLEDFNLRVRPGETIALVGPTGGGKSTIVNLLCRFYEPKEGRVLIGEHDYTDLTQHAIQIRIGMVLQTPHLFSGTIRENLRYGRLDATDDELVDAARLAGAHDFIVTLENGYDEQVGEGGSMLSVGQKQLISLARAILADPDIFIMDEATSSVDTLTEALIQRGMEQMMVGRTSFVIAHRLSDYPPRQPHPGHRGRADRRDGHARGVDPRRRALLQPVHAPVPAGAGSGAGAWAVKKNNLTQRRKVKQSSISSLRTLRLCVRFFDLTPLWVRFPL